MKSTNNIKLSHIAPCGMNCGLCIGYQRDKNKCSGCSARDNSKPNYCVNCRIKNCDQLRNSRSRFCFDCSRYPCTRLKQLDKRYKLKYGMSMLENLNSIKETGIRNFIRQQKKVWTCSGCGNLLSVHRNNCSICGKERTIRKYF